MSGQNILTGSKLCWEAIFRQGTICILCPDAILRPDEIFSMDESGVIDKLIRRRNSEFVFQFQKHPPPSPAHSQKYGERLSRGWPVKRQAVFLQRKEMNEEHPNQIHFLLPPTEISFQIEECAQTRFCCTSLSAFGPCNPIFVSRPTLAAVVALSAEMRLLSSIFFVGSEMK